MSTDLVLNDSFDKYDFIPYITNIIPPFNSMPVQYNYDYNNEYKDKPKNNLLLSNINDGLDKGVLYRINLRLDYVYDDGQKNMALFLNAINEMFSGLSVEETIEEYRKNAIKYGTEEFVNQLNTKFGFKTQNSYEIEN